MCVCDVIVLTMRECCRWCVGGLLSLLVVVVLLLCVVCFCFFFRVLGRRDDIMEVCQSPGISLSLSVTNVTETPSY